MPLFVFFIVNVVEFRIFFLPLDELVLRIKTNVDSNFAFCIHVATARKVDAERKNVGRRYAATLPGDKTPRSFLA